MNVYVCVCTCMLAASHVSHRLTFCYQEEGVGLSRSAAAADKPLLSLQLFPASRSPPGHCTEYTNAHMFTFDCPHQHTCHMDMHTHITSVN